MRITKSNTLTRYFYHNLASYSKMDNMLGVFKYYNTIRLSFMDIFNRKRILFIAPFNNAYDIVPKHYVLNRYVNYYKQMQGL